MIAVAVWQGLKVNAAELAAAQQGASEELDAQKAAERALAAEREKEQQRAAAHHEQRRCRRLWAVSKHDASFFLAMVPFFGHSA